ncbi:INO80 complex subunit E [Excalfactoria chinensis]|uniref:INO80 complex subunit E n=1 Tax=Excalfactoria chinensis TaxID=46218 RepID=UPI003B3BA975
MKNRDTFGRPISARQPTGGRKRKSLRTALTSGRWPPRLFRPHRSRRPMGRGIRQTPEAEVPPADSHFRKMNGAADQDGGGGSGCRRRYRALKRRLRLLLYEQECFQEELRRAQRRLLRVSRDKSFLLDRLLQYEQVDDDSSDSDATASSDSDGEAPKGAEPPPLKRKRSPTGGGASPTPAPGLAPPTSYLSTLASPPYSPFPSDYLAPPRTTPRPHAAQ